MINPIGAPSHFSSRSDPSPNLLHKYPEVKTILKDLGLSIQLNQISFKENVFVAALASPDTLDKIKKRLKEIEKGQFRPDEQLLEMLGIETPSDHLMFEITKGGRKLVKKRFSELSEDEYSDQ